MEPKIVVFQGDYIKLMVAVKKNIYAISRKPKGRIKIKSAMTETQPPKK